ncbi:MAG: hypothetical protein JWR37_1741 [Mycobacterium sp.]|jgi:acyl-CoA thioesterase FadM|nr:hypothetical protein [Mycobacterium sp.]
MDCVKSTEPEHKSVAIAQRFSTSGKESTAVLPAPRRESMALKTDIRGMTHEYPDYFVVGREKIREFGSAIKSEDPASLEESAAGELGYDGIVAPLTFLTVFAVLAQKDFFRVVDVGMETMQIVQVDQKFVYHKPVVAGDKLWCRFDIVSVDERFGADIVVTKNTCVNETGELVMEAFTTLMGHEGDDSVKIDFM